MISSIEKLGSIGKNFHIFPTLLLHGAYDLIPRACAAHLAETILQAQLVILIACGHFTYLECPEEVHQVIDTFFHHHLRANR